MSGFGQILLASTRAGTLRCLLPPDRDPAAWHAALTAEIGRHLTPAHAALLALPVAVTDGTDWMSVATAQRRYADLDAADRAALLRALAAILSDIRRLAESGAAPAVSACWPILREIPDMGLLHAVDGRPVLAGWGHVAAGATGPRRLLAAYDDGNSERQAERVPWPTFAIAGGALAVLALAAGLLLPVLAFPRASIGACTLAPEDRAALDGQAQADARHDALQAELARLVQEQGRRRLQCPLPQRAETPIPPPAPGPLPQDRWDRHDLAMLSGCWHRQTNMQTRDIDTGRLDSVQSWQLCFDASGHGTQAIRWDNGKSCNGPLTATFNADGTVAITAPAACTGTYRFVRYTGVCQRLSEQEALCRDHDLEGSNQTDITESRFRR
jgi:hypothetical protein